MVIDRLLKAYPALKLTKYGFKLKDATVFDIGPDTANFVNRGRCGDNLVTFDTPLPYDNMVLVSGGLLWWACSIVKDRTAGSKIAITTLPGAKVLKLITEAGAPLDNRGYHCTTLKINVSGEVFFHDWDHAARDKINYSIGEILEDSRAASFILASFLRVLSCKNIRVKKVTPKKRKAKRGKVPLLSYHILQIKQKTVNQDAQGDAVEQWSNRVHLCRGHIKEYTAERPLFGKYVGRVWCPPHARGNKTLGMVHKSYELN